MLQRAEVRQLAFPSLRGLADTAHSLQGAFAQRSQFSRAVGARQYFVRLIVMVVADMPAASVTAVMLHMERLVAFRSRSLRRGRFPEIGITVVIAAHLMRCRGPGLHRSHIVTLCLAGNKHQGRQAG